MCYYDDPPTRAGCIEKKFSNEMTGPALGATIFLGYEALMSATFSRRLLRFLDTRQLIPLAQ